MCFCYMGLVELKSDQNPLCGNSFKARSSVLSFFFPEKAQNMILLFCQSRDNLKRERGEGEGGKQRETGTNQQRRHHQSCRKKRKEKSERAAVKVKAIDDFHFFPLLRRSRRRSRRRRRRRRCRCTRRSSSSEMSSPDLFSGHQLCRPTQRSVTYFSRSRHLGEYLFLFLLSTITLALSCSDDLLRFIWQNDCKKRHLI